MDIPTPYLDIANSFEDSIKPKYDKLKEGVVMFFEEPKDTTHLRITSDIYGRTIIQNTNPANNLVILQSYQISNDGRRIVRVQGAYDPKELHEMMEAMGYKRGFGDSFELNVLAAKWIFLFNRRVNDDIIDLQEGADELELLANNGVMELGGIRLTELESKIKESTH